jgi:hypothetical protein
MKSVLFALALAFAMMVAWAAIGLVLVAIFTPVAEAVEPDTSWPKPLYYHLAPEYRT